MQPLLLVLLLTISGCAANPGQGAGDAASPAQPGQRLHVFDGRLDTPGDTIAFTFPVPEGTGEVEALLTWVDATAQLAFRLLDQAGTEAASGWNEGPGRAYVTTTQPVQPGEWTLDVSAEHAMLTGFTATVTVHDEAVHEGPIHARFSIPPRDPARNLPPEVRAGLPAIAPRDFAEVNLNMAPGDRFTYSWNATAPVYFNVHYHGSDGTTQRPIEERVAAHAGQFVANATEVYALLWRNEGTSAVDVEVTLDGTYRLHSMTRGS